VIIVKTFTLIVLGFCLNGILVKTGGYYDDKNKTIKKRSRSILSLIKSR